MEPQDARAKRLAAAKRYRRLFSFLAPLKWTAITTCSILVLKILVEVTTVYFLSPVVTTIANSFVASHQEGFWSWISGHDASAVELRNVLMWMAFVQTLLSLMIYLRSVWDSKFSTQLISSMRSAVYDRLQYLEFSFYDRMTSGKLLSRALGDLDQVHGFINISLLSVLDIVVSLTAYLALLGWRSPWLLGAALLPLPVWCYLIFFLSKKSGPLYGQQRTAAEGMIGVISENVAARYVVRAFGSQKIEQEKFKSANANFCDRLLSVVRWQATLNPSLQSLAIAVHILMFAVCAALIQKRMIPVGDVLILGSAMGTILNKLQSINGIAEAFQRSLVSGERLFEVLDAEPLEESRIESGRAEIVPTTFRPEGDIRVEGVNFAYNPDAPVLRDVSVTFEGGRVTAIIGPTGAGKTTLSALLARFYSPQEGRIWIGNCDVQELPLQTLRRTVGFVFQETFLFSDTIRNNIRYGRMDVSDEMLIEASHVAHAHDFISKLPDGYETRIGDGGVQLSGGQRQRLALARALVYDPAILVLDDAMAALDASTEAAIRERLRGVKRKRTILMITHRPSTLEIADQVVEMVNGRVVKTGAPEDFNLAELQV